MSKTRKLLAAALLVVAHQAASAIEFKVNSYTTSSVTFTLTGNMPATNPGTLADGPVEIDLLYTGNLWVGGSTVEVNDLSATPFAGGLPFDDGFTGGYSAVPYDYSWLHFTRDLTGVAGTGTAVTLSWGKASLLNTSGTGTIDLYWGNLSGGPDTSGVRNILLSSVSVIDGRVVGNGAPADSGTGVPEPASLALLAAGAAAFAARRRRKA